MTDLSGLFLSKPFPLVMLEQWLINTGRGLSLLINVATLHPAYWPYWLEVGSPEESDLFSDSPPRDDHRGRAFYEAPRLAVPLRLSQIHSQLCTMFCGKPRG